MAPFLGDFNDVPSYETHPFATAPIWSLEGGLAGDALISGGFADSGELRSSQVYL